jgi:phosphatidylglycerophosphate synthase
MCNSRLSLHIVAKPRYGLLARVLTAHALGALLVFSLARLLRVSFDLSPWYLAKAMGVYVVGSAICLKYVAEHHPFPRYGPANAVTMIRGSFVALIAGLIAEPPAPGPALFAALLAAAIAFLDGLDGKLARSTGLGSAYGARFDMETDSGLVLAMSILAVQHGKAGIWVLAIGLMRYAFAAAGKVLPWLAGPLTPTARGKTVAVVQMGVLSFVLAPFVPAWLSNAAAAIALALLVWSFAVDIGRLWRARASPV